MPSLATVVSAIVGGCVLVTLLLSYAIWSIRRDQAEIRRQRRSHQRADHYALQLLERNQRRAQRVNPIFATPIQDSGEQEECLPYAYPPVPSTSSIPRLKPSRPRTPPPLFETRPLSDKIRVAFPPGFSEDALTLSSQDLADVCISEELEMAELAEEVARESRSRRKPGAGSPPL
ncbi:hypothetical protein OBBRIDRAFT_837590 [Obba rivulosa]|uniref:Uncharacterized protein n=1 Tax=Obba rivulosa TaxID=1052685 RepID=A0A8E2DLT1_9APHY|nr:hypothetical protein OBBRIDRAFT_837590 [Obba rivulosa]